VPLIYFHPLSTYIPTLTIIERIPTQRTTTRVATLKPPKQARTMKRILARLTLLTRQLPIPTHDAITNRTLRLPLHRSRDILPPRHQTIDQRVALPGATGREIDDALRVDEPGIPLLFRDGDAVDGGDFGAGEGIGFREVDGYGHCLFVDGDGGGDFAGGGGDFDDHWLVGGGLRGGPVRDGGEFGGDDEGRNVLFGPGGDGEVELAGGAVAPPGLGYGGEMSEAEIVEVDEEPMRFFFWGFFQSGSVVLNVKFGGVDGFGSDVDENVECKI